MLDLTTPGSAPAPRCFAPSERAVLLATPGIGPGVIDRLESAGIHTFEQMRTLGVSGTVHRVCEHLGSKAWANRQRALRKALLRI